MPTGVSARQRFVSIHGPIANLFHLPRNLLTSAQYRELRNSSMEAWTQSDATGRALADLRMVYLAGRRVIAATRILF